MPVLINQQDENNDWISIDVLLLISWEGDTELMVIIAIQQLKSHTASLSARRQYNQLFENDCKNIMW